MAAEVLKNLGPDVRHLKLNGQVGFDSLPDQLVSKSISQGFTFNILCLGETGLGKSTLMETLFNQKFDFTPTPHDLQKVKLKALTYDLKESNVKLKLTIVESCGFGDQVNKEDSTNVIIEYIDSQFEYYLQEEQKIKRSLHTYHDARIHACLYFITPTGHSLKSMDLVTMKKLDSKVNLIPVIAKSDTITKAELQKFKARILNEIQQEEIKIYQFPTDDDTVADVNARMNQHVPFAVVGSNDEVKVTSGSGKTTRVRQYNWGTVYVENEAHCDFVKLREMLVRTNMDDLRERTHQVHYETYRRARLSEMGFRDDEKLSLQETYEKRREIQKKEFQEKEDEMRQTFVLKVKEKEQELKDAEKEFQAKFETVKKQHAEEKKKVEDRKRLLEEEMAAFERRKSMTEQAKQGNFTMKKKK